MSITDELRAWADGMLSLEDENEVMCIADRIDEGYERARSAAYEIGFSDGEDADEHDGWVKLPVDAGGVPICVGDTVVDIDYPTRVHSVDEIRLDGMTWRIYMDNFMLVPSKCRHVQPDSWQRIIEDARYIGDGDVLPYYDVAELVERCERLAAR